MQFEIIYRPSLKDIKESLYIEKNYLEQSTISSIEQVLEWDSKNKDIHIFVKDISKDKIVGEITILPLSEEQYIKFMNNKLKDTEINYNTLLNYESNKSYYLLFSAIAIDPEYRNNRLILSLLLKGLYDKICYIQNKKISFTNMCAEGQTLEGQKFIESFLDMKYKNKTKEGYKLYSFDASKEFDNWLNKLPKYIESYDNKFEVR